jgi:hypothetical protein
MTVPALHQDPFLPVLLESPPLNVTLEQKKYIKQVLDKACSDSKFSQKAYDSITLILTGGSVKVPVVSSLVPNSAEIGDPSFTLHVHGSNLKVGSIIIFAGQEELTTHVSDTELTTGVDMSVWLGADVLPVQVLSPDGVLSNTQTFTFVATPAVLSTAKTPDYKPHPVHSVAELKKEK